MLVRTLFNIGPPYMARPVAAAGGAPQEVPAPGRNSQAVPAAAPIEVGVITAQQSAITFAGAPAAVTLVWKILGIAIPTVASSKLFPIVLSIVVGMLIYWQSAAFTTKRDSILGFVFAFINSFAIAAAALGINTAVGQGPPPP